MKKIMIMKELIVASSVFAIVSMVDVSATNVPAANSAHNEVFPISYQQTLEPNSEISEPSSEMDDHIQVQHPQLVRNQQANKIPFAQERKIKQNAMMFQNTSFENDMQESSYAESNSEMSDANSMQNEIYPESDNEMSDANSMQNEIYPESDNEMSEPHIQVLSARPKAKKEIIPFNKEQISKLCVEKNFIELKKIVQCLPKDQLEETFSWNGSECTLLHSMAFGEQSEIVGILLDKGAKPNFEIAWKICLKKDFTNLNKAIRKLSETDLSKLSEYEYPASNSSELAQPLLIYASYNGAFETVKILLKGKEKYSNRRPYHQCRALTPLIAAMKYCSASDYQTSLKLVKLLLDKAPEDDPGLTTFELLSHVRNQPLERNTELAIYNLQKEKADAQSQRNIERRRQEAQNLSPDVRAAIEKMPLAHQLTKKNCTDVEIQIILDKNKADIDSMIGPNNPIEEGSLPLTYTVENRKTDLMMCLLENGADVNKRDVTESSPLHYAINNILKYDSRTITRDIKMARLLLSKGADPIEGTGVSPNSAVGMLNSRKVGQTDIEKSVTFLVYDVLGISNLYQTIITNSSYAQNWYNQYVASKNTEPK